MFRVTAVLLLGALARAAWAAEPAAAEPGPQNAEGQERSAGLSLTNDDLEPYAHQRRIEEAEGKRTDPVEGRYYRPKAPPASPPASRPAVRHQAQPTPSRPKGIQSTAEKMAEKRRRREEERAEKLQNDTGLKRYLAKDASKRQGRPVDAEDIEITRTQGGSISYRVKDDKKNED